MTRDRRDKLTDLLGELSDLAQNAPGRLSDRVAALSIREQAELALRLPARHRLELLLHAPKPMRLVRSLPDSEFYLTVREVGPADALPLVALGSAPQIQHMLDLEGWRGDRFDGDRAGAWVALLIDAGEPTIRRFLRAADDELLSLIFRSWARARAVELEEDVDIGGQGNTESGDELGFGSPDGNYRFSPAIKEHGPALQRFAQLLFVEQPERYLSVLWSSQYVLPAELEEESLRWRNSRLEEHGFPPWEEALSAYALPVGTRAHPDPPQPSDKDGLAAPLVPLRLKGVQQRLRDALEQLDNEAQERVLHEFFGLGNRLLVADRADTGEPAEHRAALEKAASYVSLALDSRGVDDEAAAAEVLVRVPLLELFREGYSRAVELQRRAFELTNEGWANRHERALDLLDSPLKERLRALIAPRPEYYEPDEQHPATGRTRPFRLPRELDETRVALEMAELLGRVMIDHLGLNPAHALDRPAIEDQGRIRFSTFFLTFLAWHAVRDELRGDPLTGEAASDFLRTVASRRTAAPDAPEKALGALTRRLVGDLDLRARDAGLLTAFGSACLKRLAAECGALDPGVPIDSRYVGCLLID